MTRSNAESERKQHKLREIVKEHHSAAEASSRAAVSSALTTKEGVKTIFNGCMVSITRSEHLMTGKLKELDERLMKHTKVLGNVQKQLAAQSLKREHKRKEDEIKFHMAQNSLEVLQKLQKVKNELGLGLPEEEHQKIPKRAHLILIFGI